ncbi:MAG: hypothetical protein IID54_05340 [Proteobacteria bacterium]|nr:hypothetical protein [Pseudomonadota bacterium]
MTTVGKSQAQPLLIGPLLNGMTVGDYETLSDDQLTAYLSGLVDGIHVAASLQLDQGALAPVVNCITAMSQSHVAVILNDYLARNPVPDRRLMFFVVRDALKIDAIIAFNPGVVLGGCKEEADNE